MLKKEKELQTSSKTSKTKEITKIALTELQQKALYLLKRGQNVFLTGPSGSGKSTLINSFKNECGNHRNIAITSTTGISALLIQGTTLHSYLGIGLGQDSIEGMIKNTQNRGFYKKRWTTLDTLVIDEVSMLSPILFDKLELAFRVVRSGIKLGSLSEKKLMDSMEKCRIELFEDSIDASVEHENSDSDSEEDIIGYTKLNNAFSDQPPFGGIQLVLMGDFLQLPVVNSSKFCFESMSWNKCVTNVICLQKIMRQSDNDFQDVLNDIRFGKVTKRVKDMLNSRIGVELVNEFGIKPTEIHTTNNDVDLINERELDKLAEGDPEFCQYDMDVYFFEFVKNREQAYDRARKNCLAPQVLQLCINAQVMLLVNLDMEFGLANGSRGVVVGFVNDYPEVCFLNGERRVITNYSWETTEDRKPQVRITQLPLRLAYAITVHKSQGCTLDYAVMNLKNIFEHGQSYVSLSRVKSLGGLSIIAIDYKKIQAHPKAVEYYKNLEQ